MFCDRCGAPLQPGQAFCNHCGKQIVAPVAAPNAYPPPYPGRVQSHIHLVAILWFAISALEALGGLFLLFLGNALFPHLHEMSNVPPDVPTGFLTAFFTMIAILVLAKAAGGFAAGMGLTRRASWGRTVALVMSFISLLNLPFGTALGIYTIWVLLPSYSALEYDTLVAAHR
jgi:zinc-ribbon domain